MTAPLMVMMEKSPKDALMWKELVSRMHEHIELAAPASPHEIEAIEQELAIEFPADLRQLLLETNGVSGQYGFYIVWPVSRIVQDNQTFRTHTDFSELYMPFDPLLFFGDDGSGDQYAFRILAGEVRWQDVFEWVHESDSRVWYAGSMRDYLARRFGRDSWQSFSDQSTK